MILACNTASAKALRTIQQKDLPQIEGLRRVLGVIRPTVEKIGAATATRHVGVLGTPGTILSNSYTLEIQKLFPDITVTGEACPLWVPLVESGAHNSQGADFFIQKHIQAILEKDPQIDALILGCTHYPLLEEKIRHYVPPAVSILSQGEYVAESLADYLHRHPEIETLCSKGHTARFFTTETGDRFSDRASLFLQQPVCASRIVLE